MIASLCLLSGLLVPAQVIVPSPAQRPSPALPREEKRLAPGFSGDWLLTPRLVPGQELVYKGTFTENAGTTEVQLNRTYRFENRVFVLESGPRGVELAVLTLLRDDSVAGAGENQRVALKPTGASSVRLERLNIDLQGKPTATGGTVLTVPLEGPPLLECGFSAAVPSGRLGLNRPWTLSEKGRPDTTWRVAATEIVSGTSCLRLEGVQQSENWERGKGDGTPWRRLDTVWISPRNGIAQRVERRIEHRLPGREESNHVGVLRYDLQSALQYPVTLADDRRRELNQTLQLQQTARPLLAQQTRNGSQIDVLLARVKATHDAHAQTPYREALAHLRQRLEMAKRGETPPSLPSELRAPEPEVVRRGLTIGKAAPDFVAAELVDSVRTAALRKWRGRPVLLIFFNPGSRSLDELMQSVHRLAEKHQEIVLVGLAMSPDAVKVSRLQESRGWKMPVLAGIGLRHTYEIDHTPTLVFIDAEGKYQGSVVGWGIETAGEIRECLGRWLRR